VAAPVNLLMFRSVLLMLSGSAFGDSSFVLSAPEPAPASPFASTTALSAEGDETSSAASFFSLSALESVSAIAFDSATTLSAEGDEASSPTSFFSWEKGK